MKKFMNKMKKFLSRDWFHVKIARKKTRMGDWTILALTLVLVSCQKDDYNELNPPVTPVPVIKSILFSAAGDSSAIVARLNEFRDQAGSQLNTAPGVSGGRREVNWDAVPANFTNNNNFPFDFFGGSDSALGNGRKRGLILKNTGTSFRVDSSDFDDIDASYAGQFQTFSRKRLFSYIGNNVTELTFKVPGTQQDAFVKSFAVIFSDVDASNSTSVEYFNGNNSLGKFKAGLAPQGFSFLGAAFPEEKITRVKITSGNALLAPGVKDLSDGGQSDLVVMDDFLYSEPVAQ